jgi:general secretion pathway protein G
MPRARPAGFTLIELLVVMAIIGVLLTIAVPRYYRSVERSQEAVLKQNLALTRDALSKFYSDTGKYPDALDELVKRKYLRTLPVDPLTGSDATWVTVPPEDPQKGKVYDIKSGAPGKDKDGKPYSAW